MKTIQFLLSTVFGVLLLGAPAFAELEVSGYGDILYNRYQTFKTTNSLDPIYREQIDLRELAIETEYLIDEKSKIEFEIEFEHGGVGTAMEFEPLEEFGEFETEVEKGGEIVVSELKYVRKLNDSTKLVVGKFPLYIALGSIIGNPTTYKSTEVSYLESRMIPSSWNETGFQVQYNQSGFTLRGAVVNGLNSEFFRSYNWVGGGYQRHFESVNAGNRALLASIEYGEIKKGNGLAVSVYRGNTTDNRYKIGKISEPAHVEIRSVIGQWTLGRFELLGQHLTGTLENSDLVVTANNGLGGLAKPKSFGPLGHKATSSLMQVSYNLSDDWALYVKHEHVNTFEEVEGSVSVYPRYDVKYRAGGFFWKLDRSSFMKAEYGEETTGLQGLPTTNTLKLNFGFEFES